MKLVFVSILLWCFCLNMEAQEKRDYIWLFGTDNVGGGSVIDFNINTVSIDQEDINMNIFVTSSVMSSQEGELLFYTNGCFVADASYQLMMNGDSLNPGQIHDNICGGFGYSVPQGLIILPMPNNPDLYYIIHQRKFFFDVPPTFTTGIDLVLYSLVDMNLNNNKGAVIEKNVVIVQDTLESNGLTAVKHANNIDWWIITVKKESNTYLRFLLTSEGMEGPYEQSIGLEQTYAGGGSGQAVFSPDGTKYVRYNKTEQVFLFDFDRSTGLLDNFQQFNVADTAYAGGCAISSNSRYLYISSLIELYQFDLIANDIFASKVLVAEYDGYLSPFPTNFYQMQLAPDCRIYMNSNNGVDALHVINHPNEAGLACDVQQHAIQLPNNHKASLPNFPMYRLGTDYPICDTSFVVSTYTPVVDVEDFEVYPNPVKDKLRITTMHSQIELVEVFNSLGGKVFEQEGLNSSVMEFSLAEFSSGIYFVKIKANGKWMTKKVVVVK